MAYNSETGKLELSTLTKDQVDYAYEMIDEIHPIEKYPIYVVFPYLKWVTSKCCHGLPFLKPYDPNGENEHGAAVDSEQGTLLASGSGVNGPKTYMVNGKEYKKRSKKQKKKQHNEKAIQEEPLAQLGFGIVAYTGMLYYMIFAFALFTLLMVPAFIFYAKGVAYKNVGNQESLAYAPRMIGALGYS